MPYYRSVGEIPRKRHTQFRQPDGSLYAEELMGQQGFSSDSSLLYHRHLPTAIDAAQAGINGNIAAGFLPANTAPSTGLGAQSSYDVFDLSGSYAIGPKINLRYGVDNLFDKLAVCTGGRSAADPHPAPCGGQTEAGFYDILGRSFYVGVKTSF